MQKKRAEESSRIKGVLDVTRSGKGFFLNPDGDIPVPRDRLNGAFSGDVVEILVTQGKSEKIGRVISVLERKTNTFVGELIKTPTGVMLKADDPRVYMDFLIVGVSGAPVGHKVVADVVEWDDHPPKAKVRSVLGKAGVHETEMRAIIASKGFESDFPKAVVEEAERLYEKAWDEKDVVERKDFRDTLTITIDPETAKDFDDAISYKKLEDGALEIGVHIADVTHFMRPGSILDKEAYKRATSVYLVDRTIPMLPPELSEDLCSLKPNVDRLTFSAVFTIRNNKVEERWFGRSIIRSAKRFTYEEADETLKDASLPLHKELSEIWGFASYLRKKRFLEGAIMFETDEIKPVVDKEGKTTGFKRTKYTESHQLIEELMLLANREVAGMVSEKLGAKNRVFVYRIHDVPNQEKIQELAVFLRAIGYELTLQKGGATQKDLNRLLENVKGKPEERLITTATIRSMAKAVYTTKNIGHYGLAFENYAHFTSPIRRYPDVMVHRTLFDILSGKKITEDPARIQEKAVHASEREVYAAQAERESVKMKQVEYFANLIGEERAGVISGVTEWGLYVEDTETGTEGMARLMSLTDDNYDYDPKKFAAIGAKTKRVIRLGDPVRYRVEKANLEDRTLDFSLLP
ncbi:ribonuclease R [Patescibacteria group bacterium]|nr:ribonuclease R [Patescibacteria group bacterium]